MGLSDIACKINYFYSTRIGMKKNIFLIIILLYITNQVLYIYIHDSDNTKSNEMLEYKNTKDSIFFFHNIKRLIRKLS